MISLTRGIQERTKNNKNEHINTKNRLMVSTGREWKVGEMSEWGQGKTRTKYNK